MRKMEGRPGPRRDGQKRKDKPTSWGRVAKWYDTMVEGKEGTYQSQVILPGVLKLLDLRKGQQLLDLACGQGYFAREFFKKGAEVIGVDVSTELINIARKRSDKRIRYEVAPADKLSLFKTNYFDAVVNILSIQNIVEMEGVFRETNRILKSGGRIVIVMNHPVFRIPRQSGWGWDEERKSQYRRIDSYMSEMKVPIQMHPGDKPKEITWSFHRPLSAYFGALAKAGFLVENMEEWMSHKESEPGPRAKAENRIRKEIPMFLAISAVKK